MNLQITRTRIAMFYPPLDVPRLVAALGGNHNIPFGGSYEMELEITPLDAGTFGLVLWQKHAEMPPAPGASGGVPPYAFPQAMNYCQEAVPGEPQMSAHATD